MSFHASSAHLCGQMLRSKKGHSAWNSRIPIRLLNHSQPAELP